MGAERHHANRSAISVAASSTSTVMSTMRMSVGIVEHITGITWLKSIITGVGNHAGTTPMHMRQDALVAAADAVMFLYRRAQEMAISLNSSIVGTTGHLNVIPNNMNVIPGMVELGFDIRDSSLENMQQLTNETITFINGLRHGNGIDVQVASPDVQPPVGLSEDIIEIAPRS